MPRIVIDENRCKGCELCVINCPQQILAISREINARGYFPAKVVDPPRCIGCRICAIMCPDVAIQVAVNSAQYSFFEY
ncbi:MAG: 4Fe-4S binding protein [Bradymonadales bacterium]|nr:4Fe-4S binding protein [Bradymonadales bacterium]